MSRSRAGRSASRESLEASGAVQLGIFGSRDQSNGVDEFAPVVALRGEDLLAFGGEAVEAPPPLARLLDPLARDPAALLEAVEQGIERGHLELQPPARALLDQLADL